MTATTQRQSSGFGYVLALGLFLGLLLIIYTPHAVERHGEDAWAARSLVMCAPPCGRYDCDRGQKVLVNWQAYDGKWAVQIIDRYDVELSSFMVDDKDWLEDMLEWKKCVPERTYRGGHP